MDLAKTTIVMSFLISASLNFAHAEEEPRKPVAVLEGQDRQTSQPCQLLYFGKTHDGRFRVRTSYTHDGEETEEILLSASAEKPNLLEGETKDKDATLKVSIVAHSGDIHTARAYAFKWAHH